MASRTAVPNIRRIRFGALGLASAVLLAPLLAGCHSSKSASQDVTVTACTADPSGGRPTVNGTILNHSSKTSTYIIDINFFDATGNRVSEGGATLGKVEAGAGATFHAQGLSSAKGPVTCKVASVTRTVAP